MLFVTKVYVSDFIIRYWIGIIDFTIDRNHPQMPQNPELLKELNKNRNMAKYREYMKNQLTELLTEFGQIDELFMDYTYAEGENGKNSKDWDAEGIVKLARKLQPQIIINNRLGLTENRQGWDYITPEQFMPQQWPTVNSQRVPWETCQTFSGSWGYHRDEYSWKSVHQLIVMLAETVSKGGNLLLNVGPTARGVFDERAIERLNGWHIGCVFIVAPFMDVLPHQLNMLVPTIVFSHITPILTDCIYTC